MIKNMFESLESRRLFAVTVADGYTVTQILPGNTLGYTEGRSSMAVAPDGRVFIAERPGIIRVVKDGQLLDAPFATLPATVGFEYGLNGIVLHPDFENNGYIYAFYTASTPNLHSVVVRLTADGDVAADGSTVEILSLPELPADGHLGAGMDFGPDGKLYVAVGDVTHRELTSDLDTVWGKILRINDDGSIPTDNPFYDQTTGVYRSIWARGLRNPFTIRFLPGTNQLFIADVGEDSWEEINIATGGEDFGWETTEGATTDEGITSPFYTYSHIDNTTVHGIGRSITGGAFLANGKYYFADFVGHWVAAIDTTTGQVFSIATNDTSTDVSFNIAGPTSVASDNNGTIYVLSILGALHKITLTEPIITIQPGDVTAHVSDDVTFSVTATGNDLSYQWYRDGQPISGANSNSYTLTDVKIADSGSVFYCEVTNPGNITTSSSASLTIDVIALQPTPLAVRVGLPARFSVTTYGTNVSYQWYRDGQPINGATDSSYTIPVTFYTDSGAEFHCEVSDSSGSIESSTVTLTVNAPAAPVINTHPVSQTVKAQNSTTFSVSASNGPLTYQWFLNGQPLANSNSPTYTFSAVPLSANGGLVTVLVTNLDGSLLSDAATLNVTELEPPHITTQPTSTSAKPGTTASFTVAATGVGLSYQWFRNGVIVADATSDTYGFTVTDSDANTVVSVVVTNSDGSVSSVPVVLSLIPLMPPTITTAPDAVSRKIGGDAIFSVVASGTGLSYQWYRDGQPINGATESIYTLSGVTQNDDGAVFHVNVTNADGTVSSYPVSLTIVALEPPVILTPPSSTSASRSQSITFSVTASGTGLSYQWLRNGQPITGATSATYTLSSAQAEDSGATFSVVVTNDDGSVTSAAATLTVGTNTAPTPSIRASTGTTFSANQRVTFSFSATDPDQKSFAASSFTYRIFVNTNGVLTPFMGTTTGKRSATTKLPAGAFSPSDLAYRVELTVTDKAGATSTTFLTLTPRFSNVTINSSLPSVSLVQNSASTFFTGSSFRSIVGSKQSFVVPTRIERDGVTYKLIKSTGLSLRNGAAIFTTPASDATINLQYRAI